MSIPIIFVHKGDPIYLDFSLNQAHFSNPSSTIYLITDTITNRYNFVKYIDINSHTEAAAHFKTIYKHMSTNAYDNELFCFQRWFMIKDFCKKNGINDFLYLDSDLLVYCDVNTVFKKFANFAFTITKKISPHCCYFSSLNNLSLFCDFMIGLYTDKTLIPRFEKKYEHHLKNNLPGGVCDMTAFGEYSKDHHGSAKDLFEVMNEETFDDNMNESDGFEMEARGIKQIEMKNGIPYGTLKTSGKKVRFNTLHFQGVAKNYLPDFYTGNNLKKLKLKIKVDGFVKDKNLVRRAANRLGYKIR